MCIALPRRVLRKVGDDRALVEQGDSVREVNIRLVPDVGQGDYVLVNLGVAVRQVTPEEAEDLLELWDQIALSLADNGLFETMEEA